MKDKNPGEKVVISLGGSLIIPNGEIDTEFVSAFKELIELKVKDGLQFFIIVGGGNTARRYQQALSLVLEDNVEDDDLDWAGIYSTRLNAHFVRIIFKEISCEHIITDPGEIPNCDSPVTIGSGWKPGWSTDYVMVRVAEKVGAKRVVNLSNISHVYSADPKKDPDAKKLGDLTWDDYREIIPKEWTPGSNTPFDPIASKEASDSGLSVAIMNGDDLGNLERFIDGEDFEGTTIHPSD